MNQIARTEERERLMLSLNWFSCIPSRSFFKSIYLIHCLSPKKPQCRGLLFRFRPHYNQTPMIFLYLFSGQEITGIVDVIRNVDHHLDSLCRAEHDHANNH